MSAVHMRPLQNDLNSAARVVLKMSKFQHITAAIHDQLHWLHVKQRVEFKQALFVYKVLHQTAPPYLVDMCQPVSTSSTRRHLRSAAQCTRRSCGAATQNNKIRKVKFSCVRSANLELTIDDRSRRFYFNEQFQWTFESWTVSQSLRNWLSAYVIACANINFLTYLFTTFNL